MNRFEQRLHKRLRNDEIAAGYREMEAELALMRAIDTIRKDQHMSQEKLASRMGRKREAIARLFVAEDANPTLNTLIELLSALNITADITLRQSQIGEGPLKVGLELPSSWQNA
jgi:transcriptional regulator with XRE-family HTH domain